MGQDACSVSSNAGQTPQTPHMLLHAGTGAASHTLGAHRNLRWHAGNPTACGPNSQHSAGSARLCAQDPVDSCWRACDHVRGNPHFFHPCERMVLPDTRALCNIVMSCWCHDGGPAHCRALDASPVQHARAAEEHARVAEEHTGCLSVLCYLPLRPRPSHTLWTGAACLCRLSIHTVASSWKHSTWPALVRSDPLRSGQDWQWIASEDCCKAGIACLARREGLRQRCAEGSWSTRKHHRQNSLLQVLVHLWYTCGGGAVKRTDNALAMKYPASACTLGRTHEPAAFGLVCDLLFGLHVSFFSFIHSSACLAKSRSEKAEPSTCAIHCRLRSALAPYTAGCAQ
jgi:hypothetical protein